VGGEVLVSRQQKNAVASMILLSDGEDTFLAGRLPNGAKRYMDLVPPVFAHPGSRPGPIHTFGFGAKHDAAALHTIAEATGGTFSFV
jgi:hypothetical protein